MTTTQTAQLLDLLAVYHEDIGVASNLLVTELVDDLRDRIPADWMASAVQERLNVRLDRIG